MGLGQPPPDLPVSRTQTLRCSRKPRSSNRYIVLDKKDYCGAFANNYPLAEHPQQGALQVDPATDLHLQCACKSKGAGLT